MLYRKFFKWAGIGVLSLFTTFILLLASLEFFISQEFVAKQVSNIAQKSINADLKVERIKFTAFSHFPYAGVELTNGEITSRTPTRTPDNADTLISFKNFAILINPLKLALGHIDIGEIILTSPKIYAYTSPTGESNWDIFTNKAENTPEDTSTTASFEINVKNISILERGMILYNDRLHSAMASIFINSLKLNGRFSTQLEKNRIRYGNFSKISIAAFQKNRTSARFSIDTLNISSSKRGEFDVLANTRTNIRIAGEQLANNIPLDISGKVALGKSRRESILLENFTIKAARIPFILNGGIELYRDSIYTENLVAQVEEFPLSEFLKYIPTTIIPQIKRVETNTQISLTANIFGSYNLLTGELPNADLEFSVPHSHLKVKGVQKSIKDMYLEGKCHLRPNRPDSNIIAIKRVLIDGDGILLDAQGSISKLSQDPYINMSIKSHLNLDSLLTILPPDTDIHGSGEVDANLSVKSSLDNISLYNLAKTNIKGELVAEKVELGIPSKDITCNITGGELKIGSSTNTRDSLIAMGTKMVSLGLKIDSAYIRISDSLIIKGKSIIIAGHNEASLFDTTSKSVHPFNGTMMAQSFDFTSYDSTRVRINGSKNEFRILPHNGDISIPAITLSSTNNRLSFRQNVNFATISGASFKIDAHRNDNELRTRNTRLSKLSDSLQVIYPNLSRDSLVQHWISQNRGKRGNRGQRANTPDDFAQEDYQFALKDKGLVRVLNRWNATGNLKAGNIRVATPLFPLRNSLNNADISFNLNELRINGGTLKAGQSQFSAKGSVSGIKGALSRGSRLRMNLNIDADTLNFNELVRAANAGGEYLSGGEKATEELIGVSSQEQMSNIVTLDNSDTLNEIELIIVPKNIEAELNLDVKYGIYSSIILEKASGKLLSKERCLQIIDFNARTNAGAMDLSAFYQTKSKKDLKAGFDMVFKDINVEEFVKLYPNIDSLLPMLKSFEGIINCQMAATTQLDTNMNLILSSIDGVARIKGDSLVLLDGETFAEIAKTLKFKNRERNSIDNISVELAIKDNTIEVFPFMMNMDRYSVAISGKQDMELNFDYHLSVIKSPIPLRLGIDITGNLDDYKFRIGKAKYKSADIPVYSKMIDSTRINLKERIIHISD